MKSVNVLNKINNNKTRHHVVLSDENYNRLKSYGKFGQSFDNLLGDLLSQLDSRGGINNINGK